MATETLARPIPPRPAILRLRSLENRRFRWLLLAIIAAGVVPAFLWMIIGYPLLNGGRPSSDFAAYIDASRLLAHGHDPYAPWLAEHTIDPTRRHGYIYPPVLAWALQPVAYLPPTTLLLLVFAAQLLLLAAFWWLTMRDLRIRDRQLRVFLILATVAFFPIQQNFQWGQVNLLLLLLSAVWLRAWLRTERASAAAAGIALGLSIALKFLQGPLLLLVLAGRRWVLASVTLGTIAAAWLIAAPRYLPEYFTRVLPELSGGTGWTANLAPVAVVSRLLRPASVFADPAAMPAGSHAAAMLVSLAALVVTVVAVRGRHRDHEVLGLQAAAVICVCPLVSTIVWPAHVALLVLPMAILLERSLRTRDTTTLLALGLSWLLLGPLQEALWWVADRPEAFHDQMFPLLWILSQASALGLWIVWAASLRALRQARSAAVATEAAG